jgi:hypothetical protein
MTDKLSDDDLRWIIAHDPVAGNASMARELLTLRKREREARDLLKEAAFVFETYRQKRFVWLLEGAGHE